MNKTEDVRINKINNDAAKHLQDVLLQFENEELSCDDLLALTYGYLIAAKLIGYDPAALSVDVDRAAQRIAELAAETENEPE